MRRRPSPGRVPSWIVRRRRRPLPSLVRSRLTRRHAPRHDPGTSPRAPDRTHPTDSLHPAQGSGIRCIRCKQTPTGPAGGPLVADPVASEAHRAPESVTSFAPGARDRASRLREGPGPALVCTRCKCPPGPALVCTRCKCPPGPALVCTRCKCPHPAPRGAGWRDPPRPGRRRGRARPRRTGNRMRTYITSNVSATSTLAPPARTGQPLASATAASRSSALRIV